MTRDTVLCVRMCCNVDMAELTISFKNPTLSVCDEVLLRAFKLELQKRVLRWGFLAQPAQRMHPADARSSAARRVVVLPAQVTLARGLENDPPVVPALSSLVGLRRCMLAILAAQAASGAASTRALPDSRVDIFTPVRHRFSSATGKNRRHGGQLQAARWQSVAFERADARIRASASC